MERIKVQQNLRAIVCVMKPGNLLAFYQEMSGESREAPGQPLKALEKTAAKPDLEVTISADFKSGLECFRLAK